MFVVVGGEGGTLVAFRQADGTVAWRGGTDDSRLTELCEPTPNLFTGIQNIHGSLELISEQDMRRATEVCITLARLWCGR